MLETKKEISPEQRERLIITLKTRFEKYSNRHKDLVWVNVMAKLEAQPEKLWSQHEMELTGKIQAHSNNRPTPTRAKLMTT